MKYSRLHCTPLLTFFSNSLPILRYWCPVAAWDHNSHRSQILDAFQKDVWWEVKNIVSVLFFFFFCRLLLFAEWIRDTERGRDREWIMLPLNKQGKKKKREDVCFRKSQDRTREACFLYPLFKQPYSCCNSSSILVHSRGFNLHSGPVIRFANQFLSPLCGPLSVLLYSIKLVRMGSLVLLICILNPREARNQIRMKAFTKRQVYSWELEQLHRISTLPMYL